jgi:hypothetical protein
LCFKRASEINHIYSSPLGTLERKYKNNLKGKMRINGKERRGKATENRKKM